MDKIQEQITKAALTKMQRNQFNSKQIAEKKLQAFSIGNMGKKSVSRTEEEKRKQEQDQKRKQAAADVRKRKREREDELIRLQLEERHERLREKERARLRARYGDAWSEGAPEVPCAVALSVEREGEGSIEGRSCGPSSGPAEEPCSEGPLYALGLPPGFDDSVVPSAC